MSIKRGCIRAAAMTAALMLTTGLCASAQTVAEKTLTVISEGDSGRILTEPVDQGAFWEAPSLTAGQGMENGRLRFVNEDKAAVDMRLKAVVLPYGDEEALAYLSALRIRVAQGDRVLYEGPYSRIADADGLVIEEKQIARGESREFAISLYCAFTYTGEPVDASVRWDFEASPAAAEDTIPAPQQPVWVLVLLCVAGALVILCAVMGILGVTRRRKKP